MGETDSSAGLDEQEVWARVKAGDEGARLTIIDTYLPYARQIAIALYARRTANDVELDEYVQYGMFGLLESVERYDPDGGASFKTYASYRIKGAIRNGLEVATESRQQSAHKWKMQRERVRSLAQEPGEGFSELVDTTVELVLSCLLDEPLTDTAPQADDPYSNHYLDEIRQHIHGMVGRLPERERQVVSYHYFHQMGFEELGHLLRITKGRVSQLHKQALQHLREMFGQDLDLYL